MKTRLPSLCKAYSYRLRWSLPVCVVAALLGIQVSGCGFGECFDSDPSSSGVGEAPLANGCDGNKVTRAVTCDLDCNNTTRTCVQVVGDCAEQGGSCVGNGICVSDTEQCPSGHTSFCQGNEVRRCVGTAVALASETCLERTLCIEEDNGSSTGAFCGVSTAPCRSRAVALGGMHSSRPR